MPPGMTETAEFTIVGLNAAGDGVTGGGEAIFGALPGETIQARAEGGRWTLADIVSASPARARPSCPAFGRCGGCATQHMDPDLYRTWKRRLVVDALESAKIACAVAPLVDAHGAGRRRAIFHARFAPEGQIDVGFMRRRSHAIVDIAACPVLCPALAPAPRIAREIARTCASAGKPLDIQITATDGGLDVDLRGLGPPPPELAKALMRKAEALDLARVSVHGVSLLERRIPSVSIDGITVALPAGGFLQATEAGEAAIAQRAVQPLLGAKRVADLFSGCGAFALRLARRSDVTAIDGDRAAIAALASAANHARDRRVRALARDLFQRPLQGEDLAPFDGVVFDPPRAGAESHARALAASLVPVVVAVSCAIDTFVRDAGILIDGGYALDSVTPIDQFLHSPHVEIVAVFTRKVPRRTMKGVLS